MGSLAHSGFSLYTMWRRLFVVAPSETTEVPVDLEEYSIDLLFSQAEEDEDEWIDHKINRSILVYGNSDDFEEGV